MWPLPWFPGVPDAFFRVDLEVRGVRVLVEHGAVEDKELRLGTNEARVGDAGALQERFGATGDATGVAVVPGAGDRVYDVAHHADRGGLDEGVDLRRLRVRDQQHVGVVDGLPAADGAAVEAVAVLEEVVGELVHGHRQVVPLAGEVGELEIYELRVGLAGHLHYVFGGHLGLHVPTWAGGYFGIRKRGLGPL